MAELVYPTPGFDIYEGEVPQGNLQQMWDANYRVVIHYYASKTGKALTKSSALASSAMGFWLGVVWETRGDLPSMNAAQGQADAQAAVAQAQALAQPPGSAIYFAVDFDPTQDQVDNDICAYFAAAAQVVRASWYKIGAYACGAALVALHAKGICDYDWLPGAGGWNGSRGYVSPYDASGLPAILQGQEVTQAGLSIDLDTVNREAGLFQVGVEVPIVIPARPQVPPPVPPIVVTAPGLVRPPVVQAALPVVEPPAPPLAPVTTGTGNGSTDIHPKTSAAMFAGFLSTIVITELNRRGYIVDGNEGAAITGLLMVLASYSMPSSAKNEPTV
jgi:hypothetical protein